MRVEKENPHVLFVKYAFDEESFFLQWIDDHLIVTRELQCAYHQLVMRALLVMQKKMICFKCVAS